MRDFRIGRAVGRRAVGHTRTVRSHAAPLASAAVLAVAWHAVLVAPAGAAGEPAAKQTKPPSVSTGGSLVVGSEVELQGTINSHGEAAAYYFQYGPTSAYGSQTPSSSLAAGATGRVRVSQAVTGLQSGDHYRLVATASGSTAPAYGLDHTYTVKTLKPVKTIKSTKKTGLKFTLVRPPAEGQPVGSPVTIAGALSGPGAAGHTVVLQSSAYPSGAAFKNVGAPQAIDAAGRFSFSIAHLTQSTRFRVATVEASPTYSPTIAELASVRVTLHVRSAPNTGLVRLYGTVSPAAGSAIVYLQLQQPARPPRITVPKSEKAAERAEEKAEERAETPRYAIQFSTSAKRATRSMSRFSTVVSVRKEGLYRAYVQMPRGPLASGYSKSVLLHATAGKKRRRGATG